jgi:PIN domain nuclease of toxin-antitoxin system
MRVLLDTHVFVWWTISSARLSSRILTLLRKKETIITLSLASIWEMQIKTQLGKLALPAPLPIVIAQ